MARHAALALSFIPAFAERIGTLVATGLIVGESLMGVLFAGVVARTERAGAENSGEVLALVEHFAWAVPLGLVLFFGSTAWLHGWTRGQAKDAPLNEAPMADVGGAVRSAGGFVSHQASAHCRGWRDVYSEEVFFNRPVLLADDEEHSRRERRYSVLGRTNADRHLTVIFTARDGLVRVISALPMSRKERSAYAKVPPEAP